MAGSTFGKVFTVTNWGESHGPAVGCVVDGCPAGLPLSEDDVQALLAGQAVGFYRSLSQDDTPCTVFKPMLAAGERERLLKGWRRAVQSCLSSEESDI